MSALGRITDIEGRCNGQSAPGRPVRAVALSLCAALTLSACHRKADAPTNAGRPTPSGLPVPRYVSLRFQTVNARGGPGDDYKLVWIYRSKGLPLQVIAETPDWRKVCDPDGGVAWVHKRTLDSKRSVMRLTATDLVMRKRPTEEAPLAATLVARGLAELDKCAEGWCKVTANGAGGWVRASEVWGAADTPQCELARAETRKTP